MSLMPHEAYSEWPGLMRANIMSDVQCEQRGDRWASVGAQHSQSPIKAEGSKGDAETVRLVGRARKLIRAGTIKTLMATRVPDAWGRRKLKRDE
jgi:hypothetical protein